mgnify:CR=1 FL=1
MISEMMILDIALFLFVGVATLVYFEVGVRKSSWGFTVKWVAVAATLIWGIEVSIPELEFVRIALALFIGVIIMAKLTSRAIREERRFWD